MPEVGGPGRVHATEQRTWPFGAAAIGAYLALVALAPESAGPRTVARPVWDACAVDDEGARAAARVDRFVRERLPRGADRAFTEDELRTLNAARERDAPFEPYR